MDDRTLRDRVAEASRRPMTAAEKEEQRQNFAFGNGSIANPRITRESVKHAADNMKREAKR